MKRLFAFFVAAISTTVIAACGGGSGDNPSISAFNCNALVGEVSSNCTTCANVQNRAAIGDGDLGSSATFETFRSSNIPNNGQITFVVDRTSGSNVPSGSTPGFAIRLPNATGISYTLTPSIRLNGAVTQTGDPVSVTGNTSGEFRYIDVEALAAFNGVQMNLQYNEPVGATEDRHDVSIFEACADGALR